MSLLAATPALSSPPTQTAIATNAGDAGGAGGTQGGGGGGFGAIVTRNGDLGMLATAVTGGAGGAGAPAAGNFGMGYSGTGGGGLFISSSGSTSVTVTSTVTGGAGGSAYYAGAGGSGIFVVNTSGSSTTLTLSGTAIVAGGAGGTVSTGGSGGAGGSGIGADTGTKLNVILAAGASVSGGLNADGTSYADAIRFAGTANVLELQGNGGISGQTYAAITGNVIGSTATGATNTLKWTGTGGVFNAGQIDAGAGGQFKNFTAFEVDSTGTWIIENAPAITGSPAVTPLTVTKGIVQLGSSNAGGALLSSAMVLSGGTLSVAQQSIATTSLDISTGALTLDPGAIVRMKLGTPTATALVAAASAVTLNGTLNITDNGSMAAGSYVLMSSGGAITGSGLTIGTALDEFNYTVDTATAGQVKLTVVDVGLHWNGTTTTGSTGPMVGGDGTWTATASGVTNWTNADGTTRVVSDGSKVAVFAGTGGTVTVSNANGAVSAKGLKFTASGYEITGATLTLATGFAAPKISVNGASTTATISSVLAGTLGMEKTGDGTLILTGINT